MVFNYSDYFEKVFIIPTIILVIIIIDLCFFIYRFRSGVYHQGNKIELVLQIIGISLLAFVSITQLRLGIILDNEQSTETVSGNISDVLDVNVPPKFYYKGNRVWPKLIEIDGEFYYIMTIGNFKQDDSVKVEYLPNSNVVISIKEDNND